MRKSGFHKVIVSKCNLVVMLKKLALLKEIHNCALCQDNLPLGPRPVVRIHPKARILIVGQAPGIRVHESGIPWNDQSGKRLREWLLMSDEEFYNEENVAIVPMGFCYPGTGKSGDLPPMKICAPTWHERILERLPNIQLILLVGNYAQNYYLPEWKKKSLTETVKAFDAESSKFIPLPHPSPRNRRWFQQNPWFEDKVLPVLQYRMAMILGSAHE